MNRSGKKIECLQGHSGLWTTRLWSKRNFESTVEFLQIIPSIPGDYCSRVINQLWNKNSNCGDSILAKFSNYRSYGNCFGSTLFFQCLDVGTCSQIVVRSVLEVTEVARKATGSSAAHRAASRTRIVKSSFAFVPNSRVGLALVRFFELAVAHALLLLMFDCCAIDT